jgi:hypothetical protein
MSKRRSIEGRLIKSPFFTINQLVGGGNLENTNVINRVPKKKIIGRKISLQMINGQKIPLIQSSGQSVIPNSNNIENNLQKKYLRNSKHCK